MSSKTLLTLLLMLLAVALASADPGPLSRYGRHHRGRGHRHSPPPPPTPTPSPPLPQPPHPLPRCDCQACNYTHCILVEPPNPPIRGSPAAPRPGGFPFFGGHGLPPVPPPPTEHHGPECIAPLAGLMTCGSFLTGSEDTPTPQSQCCGWLGSFLNASTAAGDGGRTLRCLCPVILGDVNKMLPKPMDPVRMMYLPIACGVVLPPQVLYICFTGQQTLPLVGRIPDVWNSSSAGLSP